jgi:alpha-L-arabinofuranosidase
MNFPPASNGVRFGQLSSLLLVVLLIATSAPAATITIDVSNPGHAISPTLFGAFFEEINYAGDGGLYGELVRNRSFSNSTSANFWTLVTTGSATGQMSVDTSNPLNATNSAALKLTMLAGNGSVGAGNAGYWGLSIQSGSTYDLSFYASAMAGFTGPLTVRLESANGSTLYAQASFNGLTASWQHFSASLTPTVSDTNARIVVSMAQAGTVWLDEVSLFPDATFHNRANGLRLDLANMLAAMKPSFYRYPGGNFIESYTVANAVRWKNTIGDPASRPGHMNDSWGYWSTDGYGLDEFFRQCEDMGMEPLYGINCVPLSEMGPWVQDALDLIEYANGDINTTWGARRAANGHPAPYNLKYLEIGNENGGPYYDARYTLFYDAIKAKYPDIHLISPVWGSPSSPTSRPVEIKDEHYYSSAATFMSYATKYDSYSRNGPKVFVGEYAVTSDYGTYGNLSAALGEAAFMTGMERNSDVVIMASYAPLFANVNGIQWHPDLIYYDNSRVFGTPSYYVQKMFSTNTGTVVLPTTSDAGQAYHGKIGLSTWSTQAAYNNLTVTDANSQILYQSNFAANGTAGWVFTKGTWAVSSLDGSLQQTANDQDDRGTAGDTAWSNYTYTLKARKISGSEGFLIMFNVVDSNNWVWWNIGGWTNTCHGIEQCVNGTKTTLALVAGSIQTNVWYDIKIQISGQSVSCYLNGTLIQSITLPALNGIYTAASLSPGTHEVILKAVNPNNTPLATAVALNGLSSIASTAQAMVLTSSNSTDENTLTAPNTVVPVTSTISTPSPQFTITLPAYSVTILRVPAPVAQPQNVTVSSLNGSAVLTWSPATGATSYTVNRAANANGPWQAIATGISGTTYTDTAVQAGTVYFYSVTAVNAAGASTDSVHLVAMPMPPATTIQAQGTDAVITVPSLTGVTYQLQQNDSLSTADWNNVDDPMQGTGQPLQITTPAGMLSNARFFRFKLTLPSP